MIYLNIFRGGCKAVNFKIVGNNKNLILALMYWSLQKPENRFGDDVVEVWDSCDINHTLGFILNMYVLCHVHKKTKACKSCKRRLSYLLIPL